MARKNTTVETVKALDASGNVIEVSVEQPKTTSKRDGSQSAKRERKAARAQNEIIIRPSENLSLKEVDVAAALVYMRKQFSGADLAEQLMGQTNIRYGNAYTATVAGSKEYFWEVYFNHEYTTRKGDARIGRRYAMLHIHPKGVTLHHDGNQPYTAGELRNRRDAEIAIRSILGGSSKTTSPQEFAYRTK